MVLGSRWFQNFGSILLCSSFLSCSAFAGGAGSTGGGNALVCFDDAAVVQRLNQGRGANQGVVLADSDLAHITSIEALDLYEAELPHGIDGKKTAIIPIGANENLTDYLKKIESRFENVVPTIAYLIDDGFKDFPDSQILHESISLNPVDDTNSVIDPVADNCLLTTMAVQYVSGQSHFLHIDDRLFNHPKHSKLSQAVLLLHEFLYSQARKRGQTDSRNARQLIGAMIADDSSMTVKKMIDEELSLGFADTSVDYPEGGVGLTCQLGPQDCAYFMNSALGLQILRLAVDFYHAVEEGDSWNNGSVEKEPGYKNAYDQLAKVLDDGERKQLESCGYNLDNCAIALSKLEKQGFGGGFGKAKKQKLADAFVKIVQQAEIDRGNKLPAFVLQHELGGEWQVGELQPLPGLDPQWVNSANTILKQWVTDLGKHFPQHSYRHPGTPEEVGITPPGTIFNSWNSISQNLSSYANDYFFMNPNNLDMYEALNYSVPSLNAETVLY